MHMSRDGKGDVQRKDGFTYSPTHASHDAIAKPKLPTFWLGVLSSPQQQSWPLAIGLSYGKVSQAAGQASDLSGRTLAIWLGQSTIISPFEGRVFPDLN